MNILTFSFFFFKSDLFNCHRNIVDTAYPAFRKLFNKDFHEILVENYKKEIKCDQDIL